MKFRHVLTYDATPDEVFAMLCDPDFREKVCVAQEVLEHEIRLTPSGRGFTLEMDQTKNTTALPAIARKITGDTTEVVLKETWRDATGGTLEILAPGKPTTISGTIKLALTGSATTETVELDIKVKVPLIGGRLEALMADQIKTEMDTEQTVAAAWLAGKR